MSDRGAFLRGRLTPAYLLGDSPVATWLRGAGWTFASSLVERVIALAQTVLIARAIGVDDYGRYALLFATISLLTPFVSLQFPFAIVYFVSRYAAKDPARAGAVMRLGERLTLVSGGAIVAASLLAPERAIAALFAAPGLEAAAVYGALLLLLSTQAGLYDAVLQGTERFRTLAIARVTTAVAGLAALVVAAWLHPTLTAVLTALTVAAVVRLLAVALPARRDAARLMRQAPAGEMRRQLVPLVHFSLPSAAVSLAMSYATWIGSFMLSRNAAGFRELAVINTAVQWRGPILIVMTALSSALLPMLGRTLAAEDTARAARLQRYNMLLNLTLASAFCLVAIAGADLILGLYGPGFRGQWLVFGLFLVALVPTVYCNVHQQFLVAGGRMWTQFAALLPFVIVNFAGVLLLRPRLDGVALGLLQLAAWVVTALTLSVAVRRNAGPAGSRA